MGVVRKQKLAQIEEHILELFRVQATTRLLAKEIFARLAQYTNADIVRAFEDLEKRWRLVVRYTKDGNDWVQLTTDGATYIGLNELDATRPIDAHPHPPKSAV